MTRNHQICPNHLDPSRHVGFRGNQQHHNHNSHNRRVEVNTEPCDTGAGLEPCDTEAGLEPCDTEAGVEGDGGQHTHLH